VLHAECHQLGDGFGQRMMRRAEGVRLVGRQPEDAEDACPLAQGAHQHGPGVRLDVRPGTAAVGLRLVRYPVLRDIQLARCPHRVDADGVSAVEPEQMQAIERDGAAERLGETHHNLAKRRGLGHHARQRDDHFRGTWAGHGRKARAMLRPASVSPEDRP
jgi:hypothetical protein